MNSESDKSTSEIPGGWGSVIAFALMAVASLFGIFLAGAPLQAETGICYVVAGATMLLVPPRAALPLRWWVLAGLVVGLSALAFLPKEHFFDPAWRKALEEGGAKTGPFVTAHPRQTGERLMALVVTVVAGLYLLGHRLPDRARPWLVLAVAFGIAAYAAACIGVQERYWQWPWDPEVTFGFFPNRNHTATVLVVGTLCGLSVMVSAFRIPGGGGLAGLAAMACAVCLGALLGYSISRAGLVLLLIGALSWAAGVGLKRWSRRQVLVSVVLAGVVALLFALSNADIKSRLAKRTLTAPSTPIDDGRANPVLAPSLVERAVLHEGRLVIYRDTADLLGAAPWTGVGLGMFEFVFPQYMRASATESQCLHPESDWLLMAVETGIPATLVLAGLVGSVLSAAIRQGRRWRGWTLRFGCVVAAMVVPVHGLFDVPGHHLGLAWLSLILVASSLRLPEALVQTGWWQRSIFRLGGAATLLAGAFLIRAEWWGGPQSAVVLPNRLAEQARALYAADHARLGKLTPAEQSALPPEVADATLKSAIALVNQAIEVAPLTPDLHYLKGALALQFDEMDTIADQAFALQRLLEPLRVAVPLWQAQGWSPIDPARTASLWANAMERVAAFEAGPREPTIGRKRVMELAMADVKAVQEGQDSLGRRALALVEGDAELILVWAWSAPAGLLDEAMPSLLTAETAPARRQELFKVWQSRGDRRQAQAFAEAQREWNL